MPKEINGRLFYTILEAAPMIGVSPWTVKKWLSKGKLNSKSGPLGACVEVIRDPMSGRYYIAAESVGILANRFQTISG